MNTNRILALLAGMLLAGLLVGCGPKPAQRESILDSPEYHVSQGLRLLQQQDVAGARDAFQRALDIEPKQPDATSGMALVFAERQEYDEALELADDGVDRAKRSPFTWAVMGRVLSLAQKGDWQEESDEAFDRAVEYDHANDLALYWWGKAKTYAGDFIAAEQRYQAAIEVRGPWEEEADIALQEVQRIQRAAPGTKIGREIALMNVVDRADLAVLFLQELKLQEVLEKLDTSERRASFQPPRDRNLIPEADEAAVVAAAADIQDHWASSWVEQILELGVMETDNEGNFHPEQPVTRSEYALFLQNILARIYHDRTLTTKYLNEESRFLDMPSGTATYNAAALCVDRNIMDADLKGAFRPLEPVTGAEALLIIRKFQQVLHTEF